MKKTAKLLAGLLSAVFLCFGTGCAGLFSSLGERKTATFTVGYDYGEITEGKRLCC